MSSIISYVIKKGPKKISGSKFKELLNSMADLDDQVFIDTLNNILVNAPNILLKITDTKIKNKRFWSKVDSCAKKVNKGQLTIKQGKKNGK